MQVRFGRAIGLAAVVLAIGARANATTITFEDIAVPPGSSLIEASETSAGFLFTSPSDHIHRTNAGNPSFADDGSTYLFIHDNGGANAGNALMMNLASGGTFSLDAIDLSEGFVGFGADSVHVVGNLSGGGTISTDFTLDGIIDGTGPLDDFQHAVFGAGWTDLTQVTFSGIGGTINEHAFAVDNIEVNGTTPVPEPATLTLLGLGLSALRLRRKRQA